MSLDIPGEVPTPQESGSNSVSTTPVHSLKSASAVPASQPTLWGGSPQGANVSQAFVGGSGKSIIIRFADSLGAPTSVTGLISTTSERIKVSGASGTFTLSFGGQTTSGIARGAFASDIQAALSALSSIGVGNVAVAGPPGGPWIATFTNQLGNQPQPLMTLNASGLGATSSATPATVGTTPEIDVDTNSPNWSSQGNWVAKPLGLGSGGHREFVAQGNGDNYALWTFSGLTPGNYRVYASWTPDSVTPASSYSTSAPYRLYDGSNYRGTYRVDQTTPMLREDPYETQPIATVYVGSGTLRVVLSDDTTGILSANLVSLVPVDPTAPIANSLYYDGTYVGNWSDLGGNYGHLSKHTSGHTSASDSATITVCGLTPGTHAVQVTWKTWGGDRSTKATYQVFDGNATTPVLTATVDQNQTPTGGSTLRNTPFQPIGTAVCTSGWFRVVLTAPDSATASLSMDAVAFTLIAGNTLSETTSGTTTFNSSGRPPSINVDGGAPIALSNPFWHAPTYTNDFYNLSTILYPLSTTISPNSNVTLSLEDNVVLTTAGPSKGVSGFVVTNRSGGTILPPPPTQRTMRIGFNLKTPPSGCLMMYANLMKHALEWQHVSGPPLSYDSNGDLIFSAAGVAFTEVTSSTPNPVDPRRSPSGPWGNYTILYDGNDPGTVDHYDFDGCIGSVVSSDVGHATNNRIVWNFVPDPKSTKQTYGPEFAVVIRATGAGQPAKNFRVYDPTIDANNPPLFHPEYLVKLQGAGSIRSAFILGANGTSISEWADYSIPTQRSYTALDFKLKTFNISSISQCTDTSGFLAVGKLHVQITVDRPHGMKTGCTVYFWDQSSANGPPISVSLASGGTFGMNGYEATIYYNPSTMSPAQFAVITDSPDNTSTISNWTGGGIVQAGTPSIPPQDYIDLVNLIPGCDAWINVPAHASDDLVTQFFTMIKTRLNPGRKIRFELSNEHWNFGYGYPQYWYFQGISQQLGGNGATLGYTMRSAHVHSLAAAALGSRVSDLIPIYGSISANLGITQTMLAITLANNFPVGGLAIAPYAENLPDREPSFAAIAPTMTVDQIIDNYERNLLEDRLKTNYCDPHYASLKASYPNAEFVGYEGSIGSVAVGGSDTVYSLQNQAVWHHPRFYTSNLYYFGMLQRGNLSLLNFYALDHPFLGEGSNPSVMYGAYLGWNMRAGLNDGTGPNAYDVRPAISSVPPGIADESLSNSVIGAAILAWNGVTNATNKVVHRLKARRASGRLARATSR